MAPPSHPAGPPATSRGVVRQVAAWLAVTLGAMVLAVLTLAVALRLTTPSPQPSPGWTPAAEMPEPRGEVASTTAHREGREMLLVGGGLAGLTGSTSTAVHLFDPAEGTWEQLPELPAPRHHAAAAALDDAVYVSGGAPSVTDWTPQDSLWVLREGATAWEQLAPMPEGRDSHRMRALDGRLHVVGGHGDTADTLVYEPDGDRWSRAASLPTPRHHLAVVAHDGQLWALGGRDHDETVLDDVHIWDPQDDAWREGPTLPRPVSAAVEGVVDGRVHLIGGEDPAVLRGGVIDDHFVLEPDRGTWQRGQPAPAAVHGAGGGAVDGHLVVAGGAQRQGALSTLSWTGYTAVHDPQSR